MLTVELIAIHRVCCVDQDSMRAASPQAIKLLQQGLEPAGQDPAMSYPTCQYLPQHHETLIAACEKFKRAHNMPVLGEACAA